MCAIFAGQRLGFRVGGITATVWAVNLGSSPFSIGSSASSCVLRVALQVMNARALLSLPLSLSRPLPVCLSLSLPPSCTLSLWGVARGARHAKAQWMTDPPRVATCPTRYLHRANDKTLSRRNMDWAHSSNHQPSKRDQIAFLRSLICTGARRNPATCGTCQGHEKGDFLPL